MSKYDPKVTLHQIADYAGLAQELCAQNELPAIVADWQKRAAFERVIEVIGEAVKRLPPDLCQRYPLVQWKLIAGMRDRISHGYDGIDYTTLWDAVQDEVPPLLVTIEQMLADLNSGQTK
jgi:uncharacterized protein with HEPN domain